MHNFFVLKFTQFNQCSEILIALVYLEDALFDMRLAHNDVLLFCITCKSTFVNYSVWYDINYHYVKVTVNDLFLYNLDSQYD